MPGEEAHFLMEPEMRRQWRDVEKIKDRNPRYAGVMALFYPKEGETHFLMILRKSYPGVHSNQVGFPGGKSEESDADLLHTALRETEEEVGVPTVSVEVVKELSQLYIPPSNFWVQPYLGLYANPIPFVKQETEVEEVLEVPFYNLLDDSLLVSQRLSTSYAKDIQVPAFTFNGHVVWGATAMMLNEIKMLLRQVL